MGKSQEQVRKLIAGPGVYICDECVELCNEILDEELMDTSSPMSQSVSPDQEPKAKKRRSADRLSLSQMPKPRELKKVFGRACYRSTGSEESPLCSCIQSLQAP